MRLTYAAVMRITPTLLLLAACATQKPAATAPTEIRRSIVFLGQRVGSSVITQGSDGTITNVVDIHDNGRGPHADAMMRLAADGTLAYLEVTGHSELNAPVDEHFLLENGHAEWHSLEERGEKDLTGPAFFLPNSAADAFGLLLAALQKNGGTLALLPGGTARLEKAGDITVPAGHLVLFAITGLGFLPQYVWARDDGSLFALVDPGFWWGEEGQEAVADTLVKRQEELRKERDKAVVQRLRAGRQAASR
jgi:hypothetical protein